jgi:subtilase family serine protease
VALAVGGTPVTSTTVAGLAPGAMTTVELVGPACVPGQAVPLTIDADNAIDEASEDRGDVGAACPSSGP